MDAAPTDPGAHPDVTPPSGEAADDSTAPPPDQAAEPVTELLTLREDLPLVVNTEQALAEFCVRLEAGTGPVALDAERASGYRYSGRAYLVQVRRLGSGTALIDPIGFDSLAALQEAIGGSEWILHAATQDLACLAELGLRPTSIFDTELAGRLLGYPRVGLATLVETLLGFRLKKEHSAVDWSTRPLPEPWLQYAALDVEVLLELREVLAAELAEAGKDAWARQEFEHLLDFEPAVRTEPWRRTGGLHRVRGRRALAAVRELWQTRDNVAQRRDVAPGRILPDSALIAAALAQPLDRGALLGTQGFRGRGAERYASRWLAALQTAADLPEAELPSRSQRSEGPPVARAWAERDPVAAARLRTARDELGTLSEELRIPAENLLTPDYLRRTLWTPPETREPGELLDAVVAQLSDYGARSWQTGLAAPVLVRAILRADADADADADAASQAGQDAGGSSEDSGAANDGEGT